MADNQKFNLKVSSRYGLIYEGKVDSITSFNEKGEFDILAQHANFISLIQKGLIIREDGEQKEIEVDNALLRIRGNKVEVYLGAKRIGPTQLKGTFEIKRGLVAAV